MKKYFITVVFLLSALFAHSQDNSQNNHLEFKGIPITGNYKDYVQKLVNQGCEVFSDGVGVTLLEGPFVSVNCTIGVAYTPLSKTVWKIAAFLPEYSDWDTISSKYYNLKDQYTSKYGEPNSYEYFSDDYYEKDDGTKWTGLILGKCTYTCIWVIKTGSIMMEMAKNGHIVLHYEDTINSELNSKETQSEI